MQWFIVLNFTHFFKINNKKILDKKKNKHGSVSPIIDLYWSISFI